MSVAESTVVTAPVPKRPPRASKAKKAGTGVVKAVLSGDTIVLLGNADTEIPPEKEVTLSGITAPRFARGRAAQDEPWAWHSREFLRKKIIGKVVRFETLFKHESSGREYVNLFLGDENIAQSMVAHGWARVPIKEGEQLHAERQALHEVEKQAEKAAIGMFNKEVNVGQVVRDLNWTPEAAALFASQKGAPTSAVVDKVIDGTTLRLELLPLNSNDLRHTVVTVYLAGAESPSTPIPSGDRKDDAKARPEAKAKAWSKEAQSFVERRLLHRDVKLLIQGIDKSGNVFGSILFGKGNIAERLLESGYAKVVKWSAALTADAAAYERAQRTAQSKQLRLWSSFKGEGKEAVVPTFTGTVAQVLSGDRITVVPDGGKDEIKVSLASIKAPRSGNRGSSNEPYALEAKESLRKKLVGKRVQVVCDYTRNPPADSGVQEKQLFGSVFLGKENIGTSLVHEGLATVIAHRRDEDRAHNYVALILAEEEAAKAKRGVHDPAAAAQSITDLTQRLRADGKSEEESDKKRVQSAQIKHHFALLEQEKNLTAVVEYVFSASRFKVLIPKSNIMVIFTLSAVRTPNVKNEDGSSNPLYEAALELVKSKTQQRTVRIELESLDKGDSFVGHMFVGKENIGLSLIQQSLASVFGPAADKSKYGPEFREAEKAVRPAKAGIWKNWVERKREDRPRRDGRQNEETSAEDDRNSGKEIEVKVTEITDAANFYIQIVNDPNVPVVEEAMSNFVDDETQAFAEPPKTGSIVAHMFEDTSSWCRVRVEGKTQTGEVRIFYIDFGNRDVVAPSALRPLDEETAKLPALAQKATLSALKAPSKSSEYYGEAGESFSEMVWEKELVARVDAIEERTYHLTIYHPEDPSVTINQRLLNDGLVRVLRRPAYKIKAVTTAMRDIEADAQRTRKGIWEYGAVSDDEDETNADSFGRVPSKFGAKQEGGDKAKKGAAKEPADNKKGGEKGGKEAKGKEAPAKDAKGGKKK